MKCGTWVCAAECSNCKRTNPRVRKHWDHKNSDVARFETPPFLGAKYTINFIYPNATGGAERNSAVLSPRLHRQGHTSKKSSGSDLYQFGFSGRFSSGLDSFGGG